MEIFQKFDSYKIIGTLSGVKKQTLLMSINRVGVIILINWLTYF